MRWRQRRKSGFQAGLRLSVKSETVCMAQTVQAGTQRPLQLPQPPCPCLSGPPLQQCARTGDSGSPLRRWVSLMAAWLSEVGAAGAARAAAAGARARAGAMQASGDGPLPVCGPYVLLLLSRQFSCCAPHQVVMAARASVRARARAARSLILTWRRGQAQVRAQALARLTMMEPPAPPRLRRAWGPGS